MEIEEAIEIVLYHARNSAKESFHKGSKAYNTTMKAADTIEDFFNWIDATSIWTYNVRTYTDGKNDAS